MAERRMFAKTIIDSDAFLDMPLSAQCLYFHLSMRGDDDGFINNPKKIQRMIGTTDDDLKLLIAKNFIIPFESGIVVIKHWKIHNYIRGDRKKETVYPEEMSLLITKENGSYTLAEGTKELPQPKDNELTKKSARKLAYEASSLPYSFDYKIRQAFYGKICPVCGCTMAGHVDECGIGTDFRRPSIQHNVPISKGGEHELGNISVICKQCNITLQDTETGSLNADEVIEVWEEILMIGKCQSTDSQLSDKCQHSIGKDSIGKESIDEFIMCDSEESHNKKIAKKEIDAFFDSLWQLYPVKKGKGQVSDTKRRKLYEIGEGEMHRAIHRYLTELKKDSDWRKPQNGSTFFNSGYVDYLDDNFVPQQRTEVVQNTNRTAQQLDDFYNMAERWAEGD